MTRFRGNKTKASNNSKNGMGVDDKKKTAVPRAGDKRVLFGRVIRRNTVGFGAVVGGKKLRNWGKYGVSALL